MYSEDERGEAYEVALAIQNHLRKRPSAQAINTFTMACVSGLHNPIAKWILLAIGLCNEHWLRTGFND